MTATPKNIPAPPPVFEPPSSDEMSSSDQSSHTKEKLISDIKKIALCALGAFVLLSLLSYSPKDPSWSTWNSTKEIANWMGKMGSVLADLSMQGFGLSSFVVVIALFAFGLVPKADTKNALIAQRISPVLFILAGASLFQAVLPKSWTPWELRHAGGIVGYGMAGGLTYLLGKAGTILGSVVLVIASMIALFQIPVVTLTLAGLKRAGLFLFKELPLNLWNTARTMAERRLDNKDQGAEPDHLYPDDEIEEDYSGDEAEIAAANMSTQEEGDVAPTPKKRSILSRFSRKATNSAVPAKDFALPSAKLLSGHALIKNKQVDKNWYIERGELLVEKLANFGVEGEVVNICPGPVITVYEFKPASGVKIREIANLSDDLTLALSALSVRIVAPIPGKSVVGIEIPSPHRETVFFRDLLQEAPFKGQGDQRIPIALGRAASGGEPMIVDLAKMPHLLVAGATGTGKSVFINTLISSLLYRFAPQQLKLILVDPKMVELSHYEGIPHLMLPVVVDSKKASLALKWLVNEMERRYALLHQFGVRHIDGYNNQINEMKAKGIETEHEFLPYLVTVIDEYADLMAVVPKEVEMSITRLAQKARASGIHLVLATQRPSTDVVTGTIKANFPSRISFRVASGIDSKTILDRPGAERLLGNGDLLFLSPGFTMLKRLQGPFLSDKDTQDIVAYLKTQGEPEYDEWILDPPEGEESFDGSSGGEENALYDQAVRIVTEKGEASISLVQRHLRIGYNRAAMLMEQMEKEGVVGASTGTSKRRVVLAGSH